MRHAFQQLPDIRALFQNVDTPHAQQLLSQVGQFDALLDLLERAIVESPPVLVRDGGVIAPGYNSELASGANWRTVPATIWINWKSASVKSWGLIL